MKKFKYEYTLLNIYCGTYHTLKTNTLYKKGTILKGEFEVKECKSKHYNY